MSAILNKENKNYLVFSKEMIHSKEENRRLQCGYIYQKYSKYRYGIYKKHPPKIRLT